MRYNCSMLPLRLPTRLKRRGCPAKRLTALVLTMLIALAGCGENTADGAFNQYLQRLARTLEVARAPITAPRGTALPAPRDLRLTLRAGNLGTLEFLALSGCEVQITIGKRNSSLGRLARDSQRLLLDLEYLQLAPACIAYQRDSGETALADTLQMAWNLKRGQLPAAIYNATLGSDEYRAFWQRPQYPAADYPANTSSAVVTAMEAINGHARRWLAGDYSADNRAFEILLSEVASGDGGALLQALAAQEGGLQAANGQLAQRTARGPLCSEDFRPAAADILTNVVRKYFIEGIQPRAAALNRRYHEVLPPIDELEQMLDSALPGTYRAWKSARDTELELWTLAPRRHVQQVQAIVQPCGATQE